MTSFNRAELAHKIVFDQDLKVDIVNNMVEFGGSFVKALGQCLLTADDDNTIKIVLAFPLYINDYMPEKWSKK